MNETSTNDTVVSNKDDFIQISDLSKNYSYTKLKEQLAHNFTEALDKDNLSNHLKHMDCTIKMISTHVSDMVTTYSDLRKGIMQLFSEPDIELTELKKKKDKITKDIIF